MMFKSKFLAGVQKHPYLYVVKISRDSGDPWITSMVNLGDSYRKDSHVLPQLSWFNQYMTLCFRQIPQFFISFFFFYHTKYFALEKELCKNQHIPAIANWSYVEIVAFHFGYLGFRTCTEACTVTVRKWDDTALCMSRKKTIKADSSYVTCKTIERSHDTPRD